MVLLLVLVLMLVLVAVAVAVMAVVAMDGGGTVGGGCSRVRQTEKWTALKGDLIHHRGPCHDRRDPHGIFRTIIICTIMVCWLSTMAAAPVTVVVPTGVPMA